MLRSSGFHADYMLPCSGFFVYNPASVCTTSIKKLRVMEREAGLDLVVFSLSSSPFPSFQIALERFQSFLEYKDYRPLRKI